MGSVGIYALAYHGFCALGWLLCWLGSHPVAGRLELLYAQFTGLTHVSVGGLESLGDVLAVSHLTKKVPAVDWDAPNSKRRPLSSVSSRLFL